jgi:pimeloyl-ACP methyl ester carboxylesterase
LIPGNITQPPVTLEVSARLNSSQESARSIDGRIPAVRGEVTVAGYRLETCRFGSRARPLRVVLLHEGLGSVALWRDFPARLAARLDEPVLAYSRVGYGQSSLPQEPRGVDFMHHEARVVLPGLLQALDIPNPILIGHSDGASIALILAGSTQAPSSVNTRPAGVAVLAPHLFVEPVTVREIAKVRDEFEASGLGERLARYHRDPAATFRSWADAWLSQAFLHWNIEAQVAAIDCPLLAIQGEDDQYGTPQQIERLVRLSPQAKALMLPDCRHSPHAEQPDVVLAALTGFVAGLAR